MTFKRSLFSKGIIESDLKRFWWVSLLYSLFLLLILPFDHMMRKLPLEDKWAGEILKNSLNLFSSTNGFQILLLCTVPVLFAVLLFQYIHNVKATAALHSLPLNRKNLFLSHIAAGLFLLFIPILLTSLALLILNTTTLLKSYYTPIDILQWTGMSVLFATVIFSISVFVGMFTGNTVAQIIFTYILQMLPTGLYTLLAVNLQHLVYGYEGSIKNLKYDFPLMLLAGTTGQSLSTANITIFYLLSAVIFILIAAFAYKLRPAETAGELIAFPSLRPVFKYGVTACTMLLTGGYFASKYEGTFSIICAGYLIGSFLGYFISEALLQKSLKICSSYKGYLGYVAAIAVLLIGITVDITGYVHRVPAPKNVKEVYFGHYLDWKQIKKPTDTANQAMVENKIAFFNNQDNIEKITLLHQHLLKNRPQNGTKHYIVYILKNGKILARQYTFNERNYVSLLKPVYESQEYKQNRFPIVTQNLNNIKMIEIGDNRTPKRPVILTNSQEIKEFGSRLRQDVLSSTFEELADDKEEYMYADIVDTSGNSIHYNLRPAYRSVIDWLKEEGYYKQFVLLPEEIEYAVLEYFASTNPNAPPKKIEIRDRNIIKELLYVSGPQDDSTSAVSSIIVNFHIKTSAFSTVYCRSIQRNWTFSEKLQRYIKQLY